MNIVTVCKADGWVDTHLALWRKLIYRNVPGAKCYLIMPYTPQTREYTMREAERISRHFADIKTVQEQPVDGYAIFQDSLRAHALTAFGLDSVLYTDTDIDIIGDISAFERADPSIDVIFTPNVAFMGEDLRAGLAAFGLPDDPPYIEPAVIYMRRDLFQNYKAVVCDPAFNIDETLPSVTAWNILARQYPIDKQATISLAYNLPFSKLHAVLASDIRIIHYGGKTPKQLRMSMDFTEWPERFTLHRGLSPAIALEWEQPYEG